MLAPVLAYTITEVGPPSSYVSHSGRGEGAKGGMIVTSLLNNLTGLYSALLGAGAQAVLDHCTGAFVPAHGAGYSELQAGLAVITNEACHPAPQSGQGLVLIHAQSSSYQLPMMNSTAAS